MTTNEITKGLSANLDPKAVSILMEIKKLEGQPYTIADLARSTGYPVTEVVRYLREEAFEPRTWEWLVDYKKYNINAYRHYLHNHKVVEGQLFVNFSKHVILINVAKILRLRVTKGHNTRGTEILYVFDEMLLGNDNS